MGGEGEGSHPIALKGIHRVPLRTALKREWEEAVNPFVRRRRWRRVPREGKGGGGGEERRGEARLPPILTGSPAPQEDAGCFGRVGSRSHAQLATSSSTWQEHGSSKRLRSTGGGERQGCSKPAAQPKASTNQGLPVPVPCLPFPGDTDRHLASRQG